MSIPLPIPFFKHPSIVWRGLKYKTLFSLSRISYFFNMCDMSQPQFLLFPPKSDRGLHYDPVQDSLQFYYVSYFFNTWVGPFPCLPFCSPKYFPAHSICCFSHRFPFLKTKCYPPPLPEYMLPHGIDFLSCEIYTNSFNFNNL